MNNFPIFEIKTMITVMVLGYFIADFSAADGSEIKPSATKDGLQMTLIAVDIKNNDLILDLMLNWEDITQAKSTWEFRESDVVCINLNYQNGQNNNFIKSFYDKNFSIRATGRFVKHIMLKLNQQNSALNEISISFGDSGLKLTVDTEKLLQYSSSISATHASSTSSSTTP